jgi:hypothetical protein
MAAKPKVRYSDLQKKAAQESQKYSGTFREKVTFSQTEVMLRGLISFYQMRESWSGCLKATLFIILAFNILLVAFVGFGALKYQDEWFLRLVLSANIADIIGLGAIIVRYLFSPQEVSQWKMTQETGPAKEK